MGFRAAVFLGFVLLLFGGNLCSATQNRSIFSTNETLRQVPKNQVTTSLEQTAEHPSNRTLQKNLVRSPTTFRLRIFQLRDPTAHVDKEKPRQFVEQRAQPRHLTSELQGPRQTAQEMLKLTEQGPDLSLPVKRESKVV